MLCCIMAYTAADVQMVERHILQGEEHVRRQTELIDRLRSKGLPTGAAEEWLAQFEDMLQQHWDHRALMIETSPLLGE